MDKNNDLFSISKLAKFSRTNRSTLLHYDRVGVLRPAFVNKQNYRYYSYEHIGLVNLVRTLQTIGMPLKEIAELTQNRSPQEILIVLKTQLMRINKIMAEQLQTQKLILTLQAAIEETAEINENEIKLHWAQKKAILLGPQNDYSKGKEGRTDYDALTVFYEYCDKNSPHINLNYSAWGFFSQERIEKGDWVYPDRYYLYTPDGHDAKPEGLYVTGYTRGYYGYPHTDDLYKRLMKYINDNDLEISGGSYEEYPLNEISIKDPVNYLIRASILVKHKNV